MEVTIGADPEFFLKDTKTKKNISAHGLVPGDKQNPHKLNGGAVQLDGTAVEFNIDPASTAFEFEYNIATVLGQIRKMIPKQYEFDFTPSVVYDMEYFDSVPEKHKELGCDPDYNALGQKPYDPQPAPNNALAAAGMRTGAGHIHLGFTKRENPKEQSHLWDCAELSLQLFRTLKWTQRIWDQDYRRAQMYGNGAIYRPKPYGVEFRTLSNAWLNYPKLWGWLFDLSREVYHKTAANDNNLAGFQFIGGAYMSSAEIERSYQEKAKEAGLPLLPEKWREAA